MGKRRVWGGGSGRGGQWSQGGELIGEALDGRVIHEAAGEAVLYLAAAFGEEALL
jgi:hypothetical protein